MGRITSTIDTTVGLIIDQFTSKTPPLDVKTFLDTRFINEDGKEADYTNWDCIKRRYTKEELDDNQGKYPSNAILVKAGTKLFIAPTQIVRNVQKQIAPNIIRPATYKPFVAKAIEDLLKDPDYTRLVESFDGNDSAKLDAGDITVFIWSRAIDAWVDASPYCRGVSTRTSHESGAFTMSLAAISCEWTDATGAFSASQNGYATQGKWANTGNPSIGSDSVLLYNDKDKDYHSQKFLFDTILQENDIVFIKFERLSMERERSVEEFTVDGRIPPQSMVGGIWDMIGLIDNVSKTSFPGSANINVNGRDLMKLLIEDGSFFFPSQIAQNIFSGSTVLSNRNLIEAEAQSLLGAGPTFKSVGTILKYIFNKFSSIGIVPDSALIGYGDKAVSAKYNLRASKLKTVNGEPIDELNNKFVNEKRAGMWRITEFIFDPNASDRVLADNSIATDNGSIINSIRKVCQEPFVEISGDTFGDKYYFIIKRQPFDEKGYKGMIYDTYQAEDMSGYTNKNIRYQQANVGGIKKHREQIGRSAGLGSLVIDIDAVDVLQDSFAYHDEAFSWYQLTPRGLGYQDEINFQMIPVVALDEYAKVFGNKAYSLEYNYIPAEHLADANLNSNVKYIEMQAFYDLQYMVQCNMYLPFARRGIITLTGNRTIKKGLFVYYKLTKEIFYVDSVSHFRAVDANGINRTTVLQVSRGLREPFIKGRMVKFSSGEKLVSYFNVVNTDIQNNADINNKEFLKNWRTDQDVFDFFIQRRQWID